MAQIGHGRAIDSPAVRGIPESIVERVCKAACVAALTVMLVVIGVDIITRSLFNFSFEISDELGSYMLVVITFVSLPVCQANNSFHHVELVQARLSPRGRIISRIFFDLLSLTFCALLLWFLIKFQISSMRFNDHAPTYLATPLWIPRLAMVLGAAALCISVFRTLVLDIQKLRSGGGASRRPDEP